MEAVDYSVQRPPVRVGIGIPKQTQALREAGAERVIQMHELDALLSDDQVSALALRPGDVVVLAQPTLLTISQIKAIGDCGPMFEVIGHEPTFCRNDEQRRMLRRLKAKGVKVEPVTRRGPPNKYPEPTPQQNAAIVTMWHSPMTLAGVTDKVRDMIGADVPKSWVRDRVKKLTGSAARDPDAPGKVPYDYEQ